LKKTEQAARRPFFNFQFSIFNSAALFAVLIVYVLLRLPLLFRGTLPLGWNSDAAIFGLMAKAIFARRDFPIFFWGQSYMGPLTSWVSVLVALFTRAVNPFALRVAAMLEGIGAIVFFWLGLRRAFDDRSVAIAMLWVAIGPAFLMPFVIAPIGAEQMFFLSAVLFWFAVRTMLAQRRDWFLFGILAGFGWWINQGVVFVIAATIVVMVAKSEWFSSLREAARLPGRQVARLPIPSRQPGNPATRQPAGLPGRRVTRLAIPSRQPGNPATWQLHTSHWQLNTKYLLNAIQAILLLDALLGALHEWGVHVTGLFLFDPVAEPLVLAAIVFVISKLPLPMPPLRTTATFLAGFAIGYAPVIVGAFTGAYAPKYGPGIAMITARGLPMHVRGVIPDLVPFAIVLIPLVFWMWRRFAVAVPAGRAPAQSSSRSIAIFTIVIAFLFYLGSARVHVGQSRYMVAALPMVYAFASEELGRWRRVGMAAAMLFALVLAVQRMQQVRDVEQARSEGYGDFLPNQDPRVILASIDRGGYRICYADYWLAYKLEWVSDGKVQFIPWHSYDRNIPESRRRIAAPVPKCFVDKRGGVRFASRPPPL
jgi:hypothetical protein